MVFKGDSLRLYKVYSVLLGLLFLPSFLYVTFDASSMAMGIFLTMIYILIVAEKKLPLFKIRVFTLGFNLLVLAIYVVISFLSDIHDFTDKHLLSFFLIILLLLSAAFLSLEIRKLKSIDLLFILKGLSVLILLVGVMPLFWRLNTLGYENYAKSIFPFAEPSHYAISVGGILFATGFCVSTPRRVFLIIVTSLMAVLYPSVILLAIALAMVALYFISTIGQILLVVFFSLLGTYYLINFTDSTAYFIERLNLRQSTDNLTALVYLQGWQDMYVAVYESHGFGLGFQNMGSQPAGDYGEIIYQLAGHYKNRADGGFLAAKIIGEFGVFGLIGVLAYLNKFYNSLCYIIKYIKLNGSRKLDMKSEYHVSLIFGHSIVVIFIIEMFGRGYGYFSPGVFLLLVAFFLISFEKHPYILIKGKTN